jgi:hypothetical protein
LLHLFARTLLLPIFFAMVLPGGPPMPAHALEEPVSIYLFWQKGCPYCAAARAEIEALVEAESGLELTAIEVAVDSKADALFGRVLAYFHHDRAAVPLVVIGEQAFLGFLADGGSAGFYRQAADQCRRQGCPDIVNVLASGAEGGRQLGGAPGPPPTGEELHRLVPETMELPIVGQVQPRDLSLPALTVLLAAVDGFNPCAMWVLVFLIGLLLGLNDERRMWLLGGAFLLATAIMYFAVMAAWLNLILLVSAVVWVRLAIGALAVVGGLWFLREYWANQDAACRITDPGRRRPIMDAFRQVVNGERLVLSVAGIMALAILVNFIELLCSAGIPAVYTQVLALNDLPAAVRYAYLGLYIGVFMFDDIAIFAAAMLALRVTGLTGTYARYSHLIGGIVLLAIGAILLLRPELLSFA